ncbi:hypothetical protein [Bacillus sp. AFS055030]|uniref:hypothetical protein n=1 Tax=Bacillus sp. AFS055030 TaxID=2033507 RepID=UPI000BFE4D4E|nr:hypothetical protein [Bacillus sp. AFS055030]PGL72948.1 hypothetical protein CN925_01865 [Bacillus sp. AFS055030]
MDRSDTKKSAKKVLVFSAAESSQTNETFNTSHHVRRAIDRLRNSKPESSFAMKQLEKRFAQNK